MTPEMLEKAVQMPQKANTQMSSSGWEKSRIYQLQTAQLT